MKRKKTPIDCRKGLNMARVLFYGGIGLVILSIAIGDMADSEAMMCVLGALGIIGMAAGVAVCYLYVRCPHCGVSLMLGGRIPSSLPHYCPDCGEKL